VSSWVVLIFFKKSDVCADWFRQTSRRSVR
jgi:hypothetical protein